MTSGKVRVVIMNGPPPASGARSARTCRILMPGWKQVPNDSIYLQRRLTAVAYVNQHTGLNAQLHWLKPLPAVNHVCIL